MIDPKLTPDDLAACESILKNGSQSFAKAARLLPKRMRESATVLYAFCRVADDLVDLDPERSVHSVSILRGRLDRIYRSQPDDDAVDRSLCIVVRREKIPIELLLALIDGFAWDAESRRYQTFDELLDYAVRVAASVGVMMTLVMGSRDPFALARACDLGVAMQLTNIARDIGEDARRSRLYLPMDWCEEEGITPGSFLAKPFFDGRVARLTARLLEAAESFYRRADAGVALLPPDSRLAVRAARLIYSDIGRVIEKHGFDSIHDRAFVSPLRKLWLLARAWISRSTKSDLTYTIALNPAQFLVHACEHPHE